MQHDVSRDVNRASWKTSSTRRTDMQQANLKKLDLGGLTWQDRFRRRCRYRRPKTKDHAKVKVKVEAEVEVDGVLQQPG